MLEVLKYSIISSAVLTSILLIYGIIVQITDGIRSKRDFRDKEYLKEFVQKLLNTFLIFFPINLLFSALIWYIIFKFTA